MTASHPFIKNPHKTLLTLSIPVFFSLIAEPATGLVDTFFVKQLGDSSMAALGVGTASLSGIFWMFSFLAITTQTEVAQALGRGQEDQASKIMSLALMLCLLFGSLIWLVMGVFAEQIGRLLAAEGQTLIEAVSYIRWRAIGAPAVLISLTTFGAMRGLQDMRTPLYIAVGINLLNMILDGLLVTGTWIFPSMGITGVALATSASQWLGALASLFIVNRQLGLTRDFNWRDARNLLVVGGDLFLRTAALNVYIWVATRQATAIGDAGGAANTAIRPVFLFVALGLDAFAVTTQSLVGFFYGANDLTEARRVIRFAFFWAFALGLIIGATMWLGRFWVIEMMVPESAVTLFIPAWFVITFTLPLNSITYITDGAHWGTGDYRFLRNAMIFSTIIAVSILLFVDVRYEWGVALLWSTSFIWTTIRGIFGFARIWPGIGDAKLQPI